LNDDCKLQAYPYVVADPLDYKELSVRGLIFDEFPDPQSRDQKVMLVRATEPLESISEHCLEVLDYMCSERSKGYYVAFQVVIDGTAEKYNTRPNEQTARESAKDKALKSMLRLRNDNSRSPRPDTSRSPRPDNSRSPRRRPDYAASS
jgi:hypothetical protein